MNRPIEPGLWALTEKEKQTLRLIVRGHDAKSTARNLGLSVHTINERLRDARRKMAVSSSREAARLLLAAEGGGEGRGEEPASPIPTPEYLGDIEIGEVSRAISMDQGGAPIGGAGRAWPRPWIIIGGFLMTIALGLFALAALSQADPATPPALMAAPAAQAAASTEVSDTALAWLALLDQGKWDEAYRLTGSAFQKLNTPRIWAAASENARRPLGAVVSRVLLSQQDLPAPPYGYEVVKFRTSFANKPDTIETVSLEREGGRWRVVGVTIG